MAIQGNCRMEFVFILTVLFVGLTACVYIIE